MKLFAIYGQDEIYQGLHGMIETEICEAESEKEALTYAKELSYNVIESYSCIQEELELEWQDACDFDDVDQYMNGHQWVVSDVDSLYPAVGFWAYEYLTASKFKQEYLFETKDGKNLRQIYAAYMGDDLSLDVFNDLLVKQGYIYNGIFNNALSPVTDIYFSADGKDEVQTYVQKDGAIIIFYQPTDPDDFQYIVNPTQDK